VRAAALILAAAGCVSSSPGYFFGSGDLPSTERPASDLGSDLRPAGVEGLHLLSFATPLNPQQPFQFRAAVTVTQSPRMLGMVFRPLRLWPRAQADREPLGVEYEVEVELSASDTFTLSVQLMLPGEANPVSGQPVEGVAVLRGELRRDRLCGTGEGMIFDPVPADLRGSTWSTVPAVTIDRDSPRPEVKCP
jgi:hypothetical protein